LKVDRDGLDTYVDDFLLTYRIFVKSTRDITSHLLDWCNDYVLREKVDHQSVTSYNKIIVDLKMLIAYVQFMMFTGIHSCCATGRCKNYDKIP